MPSHLLKRLIVSNMHYPSLAGIAFAALGPRWCLARRNFTGAGGGAVVPTLQETTPSTRLTLLELWHSEESVSLGWGGPELRAPGSGPTRRRAGSEQNRPWGPPVWWGVSCPPPWAWGGRDTCLPCYSAEQLEPGGCCFTGGCLEAVHGGGGGRK